MKISNLKVIERENVVVSFWSCPWRGIYMKPFTKGLYQGEVEKLGYMQQVLKEAETLCAVYFDIPYA